MLMTSTRIDEPTPLPFPFYLAHRAPVAPPALSHRTAPHPLTLGYSVRGRIGIAGLFWPISAIAEHHAVEQARAAGRFLCGNPTAGIWIIAGALMVFHFAVGSILGALDQRARTPR